MYVGCFVFFSDLCIQGSNFVCVGVVFSSVICVISQAVILCVCCWCCVFFSDLCIQGSNFVFVGVVFSSVICVPQAVIYVCWCCVFLSDLCTPGSNFVFVFVGVVFFFSDLCLQDSNFVRVDVLFSSAICVSKVVILCMCWYCVFFSNLCFQGVSSNFVHAWVLCFCSAICVFGE